MKIITDSRSIAAVQTVVKEEIEKNISEYNEKYDKIYENSKIKFFDFFFKATKNKSEHIGIYYGSIEENRRLRNLLDQNTFFRRVFKQIQDFTKNDTDIIISLSEYETKILLTYSEQFNIKINTYNNENSRNVFESANEVAFSSIKTS